MIIDRKFCLDYAVCTEGYRAALELDLIGKELEEVEAGFRANNYAVFADWLLEAKNSEKYVRDNGSEFTMGSYQIFNPIDGKHTRYETEAEMRAALVEMAKLLLTTYPPLVVQELRNEKGDATWIPTEIHKTLTII